METKAAALTIGLIALVCGGLGYVVYCAVSSQYLIQNTGNVVTIGVSAWADSACTIPFTSYNWGNLLPSETKHVALYVKNNGTQDLTLLHWFGDWTPPSMESSVMPALNMTDYMPIASGQVIHFDYSVTIAAAPASGSFSYTVTIQGDQ